MGVNTHVERLVQKFSLNSKVTYSALIDRCGKNRIHLGFDLG